MQVKEGDALFALDSRPEKAAVDEADGVLTGRGKPGGCEKRRTALRN